MFFSVVVFQPVRHERVICQCDRGYRVPGFLLQSCSQECDRCGPRHLHQLHQCCAHSNLSQAPDLLHESTVHPFHPPGDQRYDPGDAVLLFLISYTLYKIHISVCCSIILIALFTTENTPLNLACMAVECYVAICIPLRHSQICTVKRVLMLIGLIWATTVLSVLPDLFVTVATEPLEYFSSYVFCLRETAFPNPHLTKKRDITYIVYLVMVWFVIFYTYFKIVFTAKSASGDAKKARNTILLHGFQVLLCMTAYTIPFVLTAVQQWFPKNFSDVLFAFYITVQVLPRSISPIIYGIRDKTYRKYLKRHMFCRVRSHRF
uniref:G-protein coupled receptors family 1 profile domain-containing protein n=1 Tax=Acanthochromis polyacanthus TaxID=80966 RepID=A0A3Q1EFA9_9TELE